MYGELRKRGLGLFLGRQLFPSRLTVAYNRNAAYAQHQALFDVPEEEHLTMAIPIQGCSPPGHYRSIFPTRSHCLWCKEHPQDRPLKKTTARRALGEVVNGVRPQVPQGPSNTNSGCGLCGTHLCRRGPCFDQWHPQNRSH
jgi:hypothetical protein